MPTFPTLPDNAEFYWFLLQPSNLIAASLLLSSVLFTLGIAPLGRMFLQFALLLVFLPMLLPIHDFLAIPLENYLAAPSRLPERVDGIIVLGGAVQAPIARPRGQLALNQAGERILAGAALARRYPEAQIVITGNFPEDLAYDFSNQLRPTSLLYDPSFQPGRITWVGEARSTYEDGVLSLQAVNPQAGQRWLLVTSALHMPRALGVFQQLGWSVLPFPVDYRSSGNLSWRIRNFSEALNNFDDVVREWGALIVYQQNGRTGSLFPRRP